MKALVVAHDAMSLPAMLGEAAAERGVDCTTVIPDRGETFPAADGFDFLMVMGAPWSLDDPEIMHWMEPERALLAEAVAGGVPVLGVCFGGQALAEALGGTVGRGPRRHIGWEAVESLEPALVHPGPWLHWHGDAFTLPPDARLLARNSDGPQAFVAGPNLGVQFHPEATAALIEPWVRHSEAELARLGIDGEALLAETARQSAERRPDTFRLFDVFLDGVRAHAVSR